VMTLLEILLPVLGVISIVILSLAYIFIYLYESCNLSSINCILIDWINKSNQNS
jgi:hypothetical protein